MSDRRQFLKAAAVSALPMIVPARLLGKGAPGNTIQVAQIGCGRIARSSEFPGMLRHANAVRYVAACDLDMVRLADAKRLLDSEYARRLGSHASPAVKTYRDYRELLGDKSIDAVCISTPDHWHAQIAMEAALAGKDVYLQKPASLTIREGRQMADVIRRTGRILQIGSQQRSEFQFRYACELVRNGRIGKVKQILVGLPADPSGEVEKEMPVPANLDYAAWLGSTPLAYYTEKRVHPQSSDIGARYERPGWLRCEQFGAGMITGWGAHHIDIAHWAMDMESAGPVEIEALAEFPKSGLWNVHGRFHVQAKYSNGAAMYVSDAYETGVRFIGEDGWIWVTRGDYAPGDWAEGKPRSTALDASDLRILRRGINDAEVHLHESTKNDHHLDWLTSIRTRKPPAAPAEAGHRACTACLLGHAAMKLNRILKWDPKAEQFPGDEEANALLARAQRAPYGTDFVKG